MSTKLHPCQTCGACCSIYRVAFDASEVLHGSLNVPRDLAFRVDSKTLAMKTTRPGVQRCVALTGHIGKNVSCSIYLNRPSPCRKFTASFEDGLHHPRCDEARLARGLPALTPVDWIDESLDSEKNRSLDL